LLERADDSQVKNLSLDQKDKVVRGSIIKHKKFKRKVDILLVDDLYQTGTTIKEVCNVLSKDRNVNNIYVLTMTKTKG
jgi:competence protein ComFC